MQTALDLLSILCLVGGSLFAVIGGIGVLRLPDLFTRMHGAGITDTLGAGLILTGLMLQSPALLVTVKLIMILVLILITSPTSTHALARSAFFHGVEPRVDGEEDQPSPS